MTQTALLIGGATVLAAVSLWLLLPRGRAGGKAFGILAGLASLGLFAWQLPQLVEWGAGGSAGWNDDLTGVVFLIVSVITVVSAVASVSLPNPIYCAIWFALTLLGSAALFLIQGAQFLGVATVVVYAGAILVTFLFVLMLAQPQGQAYYDRLSWEAMLSATTGAVMVGILTMTVASLSNNAPPPRGVDNVAEAVQGDPARPVDETPVDPDVVADAPRDRVLAPQHVAGLGAELFGKHLISLEIAGLLLFVALAGAVAIVAHEKTLKPVAHEPGRSTPHV